MFRGIHRSGAAHFAAGPDGATFGVVWGFPKQYLFDPHCLLSAAAYFVEGPGKERVGRRVVFFFRFLTCLFLGSGSASGCSLGGSSSGSGSSCRFSSRFLAASAALSLSNKILSALLMSILWTLRVLGFFWV